MKFESYFDKLFPSSKAKVSEFHTCPGERFITTYEYDVIDGIKMLVPSGEHDIQLEIDSFEESQDINNIIARFLNGDTSVLNPKSGVYGDFTHCPKTYAEMFSHVQKCENIFNNLPVEIKEKFDNSYQKFWSDMGTDSFDNVFSEYNSKFGKQGAESTGISESTPPVGEKGATDAE